MSIEKPRSRLLCKYVAGLYAFHEVEEYPRHYKIYPNPNTAVALYRGANVTFSDYKLGFSSGDDIGILISDRYRKPCQEGIIFDSGLNSPRGWINLLSKPNLFSYFGNSTFR